MIPSQVNIPAVLWADEKTGLSAPEKGVLMACAIRCDAWGRVTLPVAVISAAACVTDRTARDAINALDALKLVSAPAAQGRLRTITLAFRSGGTSANDAATSANGAATSAAPAEVGPLFDPPGTSPDELRQMAPQLRQEMPKSKTRPSRARIMRVDTTASLPGESSAPSTPKAAKGGRSPTAPATQPPQASQELGHAGEPPGFALTLPGLPPAEDPVATAFQAWNRIVGEAAIAAKMPIGDDRAGAIRRTLKLLGGQAGWEAFLRRVAAAPHLTGLSPSGGGWKASLAWVLKPANFRKIEEGNYDPRGGPSPAPKPSGSRFDPEAPWLQEMAENAARDAGYFPPDEPPEMDGRDFIDSTAEETDR